MSAVRYSPLCETNVLAYLAYCYASHGASVGRDGHFPGITCGTGCDGSRGDDGGHDCASAERSGAAWASWMQGALSIGSGDRSGGAGGGLFGLEGPSVAAPGVAAGADVDKGRSVGGHDVHERTHACAQNSDRSAPEEVAEVVSEETVGVSSKTLMNRRKRHERKERKRRNKAADSVDWRSRSSNREVSPLQASLEAKWAAENALAKARAEQQLEVLKARDMEALKKAERVKVRKQSERDMVAIEKAHQTLAATGNVPGIQPGFCETVISDGEVVSAEALTGPTCTISPDSSASMKEFRECQKKLLDSEKKVEELEAAMVQLRFDFKIGRVLDGRGEDFTVYSESVAPEVREAIEKGLKPDQVLEDELLMGGDRKVFRARFDESYYDQFEY